MVLIKMTRFGGFIIATILFQSKYNTRMIVHGRISGNHLRAIDYFDSRLFSRQLSNHVHVQFQFKKLSTHWGMTSIEDYNKSGKPRFFIVEVKKDLSEKQKLITIAHELIHVKQYVKNELNEQMSYWCGQSVNSDEIPYSEQPWEVEAFQFGEQLYHEYQFSVKSTRI